MITEPHNLWDGQYKICGYYWVCQNLCGQKLNDSLISALRTILCDLEEKRSIKLG